MLPLKQTLEADSTVVIVSYNSLPYLRACLNSVIDELGPSGEVIVVDNASTDGSAELITQHYPSVKLVKSSANNGFAAACNLGARLVSRSYLIFLNPDTIVCRGWLSELVSALYANSNIGLCTSKTLLMSQPDKIQACGLDIHYTGLSFARGFGEDSTQYAVPENINSVFGASFAIRTDLWRRLGGFDDKFFMYYEETDLSWRAQLQGYRTIYIPGSVVYHAQGKITSASRLTFPTRNRCLLLLKNWHVATLVILLPSLFLAEAVDILNLIRIAGWRGLQAKMEAYSWLVANRVVIQIAHRNIQSSRSVKDFEILSTRASHLSTKEFAPDPILKIALGLVNAIFDFLHVVSRAALQIIRI